MAGPTGALREIDSGFDEALCPPPLGSDPGIWVTQRLALIYEKNQNGVDQ